jgi:hypothetical protein
LRRGWRSQDMCLEEHDSYSSSYLINCAQYRAGIDRLAIFHQDRCQNAGGRRSDVVRHVISIDLDQGLADADWIANALEPSPDRQPQGVGNFWHFYFCSHYSLALAFTQSAFDVKKMCTGKHNPRRLQEGPTGAAACGAGASVPSQRSLVAVRKSRRRKKRRHLSSTA